MISNYFSHFIGALANMPLPQPLAQISINVFASIYKINISEATKPLNYFRSIGEFFVRDIKPELRPIAEGLVSPVDGTLRDADVVRNGMIPQVKGKSYKIDEFLGDKNVAETFKNGSYLNLYLSPTDCHHIFAPIDGKIKNIKHIPGKLFPVNDWALRNIDNLFVRNERVVVHFESEFGEIALVMVGATNVGKIKLHVEKSFQKAQKIGTFYMGSSVIIIFQKKLDLNSNKRIVKYGERLF